MQSNFIHNPTFDTSKLSEDTNLTQAETNMTLPSQISLQQPFEFQSHFNGSMVMYSDSQTVATYLDEHQGWFCRCAQPMKVESLDNNSYTLVIGQFGSFGYQVEPKIAVVLLPPEDGTYHMHSIPVPDYTPVGYDVDYQAALTLQEVTNQLAHSHNKIPDVITRVEWQLQLGVAIQFPKFIYKLPQSLIQKTGDRLLSKIVNQISRRLTHKVQQDFHSRLGLPLPQ